MHRARVLVCSSGPELRAKVQDFLSGGARVAVMSFDSGEALPDGVLRIRLPSSLPEMARELYGSLRLADPLEADVVVAVCPPTSGLGLAIADRLRPGLGSSDEDNSHAGKADSA